MPRAPCRAPAFPLSPSRAKQTHKVGKRQNRNKRKATEGCDAARRCGTGARGSAASQPLLEGCVRCRAVGCGGGFHHHHHQPACRQRLSRQPGPNATDKAGGGPRAALRFTLLYSTSLFVRDVSGERGRGRETLPPFRRDGFELLFQLLYLVGGADSRFFAFPRFDYVCPSPLRSLALKDSLGRLPSSSRAKKRSNK